MAAEVKVEQKVDHVETSSAEAISNDVVTSSAKVFESFRSSLPYGNPHPGDISESSILSSVPLPPLTYPCDGLFKGIIDQGKLSQLQLEGVLYAGQQHCIILGDGRRAGFFIGDGAGVGKGRQIAGVIIDNCSRGRMKHVWMSTSTDLCLDARRDLTDLGCHVNVIDGCQALSSGSKGLGMSAQLKSGVLFSTYSTLVSEGGKSGSRLQQMVKWCGGADFDGCLVFDEAHKAKNFIADKEGKVDEKASSKVSAAVIAIQSLLPKARVIYASATGVSDISNLVYADRLGLWGKGNCFETFAAFEAFLQKRGLGGLEMLAMEMKSSGMYVSRNLNWAGAEFSNDTAPLSDEFTNIYDGVTRFMKKLRTSIQFACNKTNTKQAGRSYWSLHVRVFKELCVAAKVQFVAQESLKALQGGCAVVIGLQTTGEAGIERVVNKQTVGIGGTVDLNGFVSTAQQSLLHFIETLFPIQVTRQVESEDPLAIDSSYLVEDDAQCLQLRRSLIEEATQLTLPPAPLDALVDALGGPTMVAEMTGRRGRVVRHPHDTNNFRFEPRALRGSRDMDNLNVREKELFMQGKKHVAIISDAASTGISLHSALSMPNQRRRVHITIELPWSAEKAIQQVASRLMQLGALTRGDRRAAIGGDWSDVNHFESRYGKRALDHIIQHGRSAQTYEPYTTAQIMAMGVTPLPPNDMLLAEMLPELGLDNPSEDSKLKVKTFLNRLLGIEVSKQNIIFERFNSVLTEIVCSAKEAGTFDEGVADLKGTSFVLSKPSEFLSVDLTTSAKTVLHEITSDRGVSFMAAVKILLEHRGRQDKRKLVLEKIERKRSIREQQSLSDGVGEDMSDFIVNDINNDDDDDEDDDDLIDTDDEDDDDEPFHKLRNQAGSFKVEETAGGGGVPYGFSSISGSDSLKLPLHQRDCAFFVRQGQFEMESTELFSKYRRLEVQDTIEQLISDYGSNKQGEEDQDTRVSPMTEGSLHQLENYENSEPYTSPTSASSSSSSVISDQTEISLDTKDGSCYAYLLDQSDEVAKLAIGWTTTFEASAKPDYPHGKRISQVAILGGAILPIWALTEQVVRENRTELTLRDKTLRVVRVTANDGTVLAGVKFPHSLVPKLKEVIQEYNKQKLMVHQIQQLHQSAGIFTGQKMQYQIEAPSPLVPRSIKIASTPQPTMKSFFSSAKPTAAAAVPTLPNETGPLEFLQSSVSSTSPLLKTSTTKRNSEQLTTPLLQSKTSKQKTKQPRGIQSFFPKPSAPPSSAMTKEKDELIDLSSVVCLGGT